MARALSWPHAPKAELVRDLREAATNQAAKRKEIVSRNKFFRPPFKLAAVSASSIVHEHEAKGSERGGGGPCPGILYVCNWGTSLAIKPTWISRLGKAFWIQHISCGKLFALIIPNQFW